VRGENDSSERPADAWVLPSGNFLAAEHNPQRVTERDRNGKVVWSHQVRSSPVSCQRLPNGNVFIATYNEVLEVTRAGKELYAYRRPHMIFSGQKLRNGRIVYAHGSNGVVELDAATGKEIHTISINGTGGWAGVEKLRNGHYLVACYGGNRVTEIDASGKQYWNVPVTTPGYATRLPNGNTLVCSIGGLFVAEYDRAGKEVWRQQTKGRPFRVHRR
jgi:outer membrane protein assembly factor BamB